MKHFSTIICAGVIALSAQAAFAEDPNMNTVVATVDGKEILLGEMIISRAQLPQQYLQLPDDVLWEGVLDQLIQQQLLANALEKVPARVELAMSNDRRGLLAAELIDALSAELITEEAIQAAYDAQFADVEPVLEYSAAHILLASEEEAAAAKLRADSGEDFAELARQLSTGPSGPSGGDLGWFSEGMMVQEFQTAVEALEAGQVSDPVQTQFGWHIIKLNETRNRPNPTLEEMRAEIAGKLQEELVTSKLAELTAAAEITRPEEGAFDPALLKNLDLLEE
ncbi:peptidylprolyl isomerase [Marivivens sp. LCG002]|uniref:peptidylprolyl isomerase n=1 Tax=Marivivens sp. LCG002 TaxID=3051171 RepID=UPI002554C68A|nr:peptidylprolyl isomerase [Marivivens sp. LCG002]WIV50750.1 peptidylprolyl isomerase [Marivivens sp. LCG002]